MDTAAESRDGVDEKMEFDADEPEVELGRDATGKGVVVDVVVVVVVDDVVVNVVVDVKDLGRFFGGRLWLETSSGFNSSDRGDNEICNTMRYENDSKKLYNSEY